MTVGGVIFGMLVAFMIGWLVIVIDEEIDDRDKGE